MQFNNPDVAAQFECLAKEDRGIAFGDGTVRLSNITLAQAERLLKQKSPHLKRKEAKAPKPPKVTKVEEETAPSSTSGEGDE
jgi:hypothetical protein